MTPIKMLCSYCQRQRTFDGMRGESWDARVRVITAIGQGMWGFCAPAAERKMNRRFSIHSGPMAHHSVMVLYVDQNCHQGSAS